MLGFVEVAVVDEVMLGVYVEARERRMTLVVTVAQKMRERLKVGSGRVRLVHQARPSVWRVGSK